MESQLDVPDNLVVGGIHLFNNDVLDPYGLKDDATIERTNERLFAELTAIRERVEAFPDELNW